MPIRLAELISARWRFQISHTVEKRVGDSRGDKKNAAMISSRNITALAAEIAKRFRPWRIILFGSHAYGAPTSDSDVDMLVIMSGPCDSIRKQVEIHRAIRTPFPAGFAVAHDTGNSSENGAWRPLHSGNPLPRESTLSSPSRPNGWRRPRPTFKASNANFAPEGHRTSTACVFTPNSVLKNRGSKRCGKVSLELAIPGYARPF